MGTDETLVTDRSAEFDRFAAEHGEHLRRALVARHGVETGNDVCADALAYAWEHWDRVGSMANPAGYLYRVAGSASRRHRRWDRLVDLPVERARPDEPSDPGLHVALGRLTEPQRICVVLVKVHDWTYEQTASVTGMSVAAVTNHVHRGLGRLRKELEVE